MPHLLIRTVCEVICTPEKIIHCVGMRKHKTKAGTDFALNCNYTRDISRLFSATKKAGRGQLQA